ncbi:MAG TPA: hypothetical protein VN806_01035, partial [Caulobacteraceae bacterium]|nr:hypothetical protein [Caulobacteraceae bacterium]
AAPRLNEEKPTPPGLRRGEATRLTKAGQQAFVKFNRAFLFAEYRERLQAVASLGKGGRKSR